MRDCKTCRIGRSSTLLALTMCRVYLSFPWSISLVIMCTFLQPSKCILSMRLSQEFSNSFGIYCHTLQQVRVLFVIVILRLGERHADSGSKWTSMILVAPSQRVFRSLLSFTPAPFPQRLVHTYVATGSQKRRLLISLLQLEVSQPQLPSETLLWTP